MTGDGGFQMNIQEFATAMCQETNIIVCVLNNYYLGMVRQIQQLFMENAYEATCLKEERHVLRAAATGSRLSAI